MKRLALTLALGLSMSACALGSQTQIPAGQTFLLGGEQRSDVLVEGRNVGPVAVELWAQKDGKATLLRRIEPGALFSRRFASGERVQVRNVSAERQARVQFALTDDVSRLSMTYDAAR